MPAPLQRPPAGRVSCQACGASWPDDDGTSAVLQTCPACTATDPNAGGSPARPEAEDDALIDAAAGSSPARGAGPARGADRAPSGRDGGVRDAGVQDAGRGGRNAPTGRPGTGDPD